MTANLTPDERVHYAWLAGDYAPEALVDSLDLADPEVSDWMEDHGMYSADDLQKLADDKESARDDLVEANDRIADLESKLRDALDFMSLTSPDEGDVAAFQAEVMELLK